MGRRGARCRGVGGGTVDVNECRPRHHSPTSAPRCKGPPDCVDAKVSLYTAMRKASVAKAELARRLGWGKVRVGRLLDLDHGSRWIRSKQRSARSRSGLNSQLRKTWPGRRSTSNRCRPETCVIAAARCAVASLDTAGPSGADHIPARP